MALHIKYKLQNLAHLISIRDFINSAINGMGVNLSRIQIKEMSNKLTTINALLVKQALELNLEELDEPKMVFESTQDVNDVMKQMMLEVSNIDEIVSPSDVPNISVEIIPTDVRPTFKKVKKDSTKLENK